MKNFFVFQNKDSARAYIDALIEAGFQRTTTLEDADLFLLDTGSVGRRYKLRSELSKNIPGFAYPHTPTTYWLWDEVFPTLPLACDFVAAAGAKMAMERYGYSGRIEVCGFPRCKVKPFKPTTGTKLLFVPARPRRDNGRQELRDKSAFDFILRHMDSFEQITVCHLDGQFDMTIPGIRFITTNPKASQSPTDEMIERIELADLVISTTTPAALAVARGVPTIFYGESAVIETLNGRAPKHFELYKDIYTFPLTLEEMDIEEVLAARTNQNSDVEFWKENNIGQDFDAEKFLSIVREYV